MYGHSANLPTLLRINKCADEPGGNPENRTRPLCSTTEEAKKKIEGKTVASVCTNSIEDTPGGSDNYDTRVAVLHPEDRGTDGSYALCVAYPKDEHTRVLIGTYGGPLVESAVNTKKRALTLATIAGRHIEL